MLIAIASGKGGVGKTCLAIGLTQALAEAGQAPLLVDGDLGLANVDLQLGLQPHRDLGDVMAGRCTIGEAAIRHPAGFEVLPGRSGSVALAAMDGSTLADLLRVERRVVVLDLGAGLGAAQRHLAARAGRLMVVVNEEPTSLTDAYAVLKLHRRDAPQGRAGVLVNMATGRAQALKVHATLDAACRSFLGAGVPLLGAIRRDARVPAAIRAQVPLLTRYPTSQAAQDLRDLAAGLLEGPLSASDQACARPSRPGSGPAGLSPATSPSRRARG